MSFLEASRRQLLATPERRSSSRNKRSSVSSRRWSLVVTSPCAQRRLFVHVCYRCFLFSPCFSCNGRCSLVIHLGNISHSLHTWTLSIHFPEGFERAARIRVIWNKRAPVELTEVTAPPPHMRMGPFGDLGTGVFQEQLGKTLKTKLNYSINCL